MTKQFFYVEITDTFAGEANYSWVTRHKVRASTPRGAMRRIGAESGLSWRLTHDHFGEAMVRYDSKSGATCAFVFPWDDEIDNDYLHVNVME